MKGSFTQVREEKVAEEKTKKRISTKKMGEAEARKQKVLQMVSTVLNVK